MFDYLRIIKECFWDTEIDKSEILKIANGNDFRKKQFLFEKILLNSTKMFNDLNMFNKKELKKMLSEIKISSFNKNYILRRKNLVEVYFFDSELLIDELKWVS